MTPSASRDKPVTVIDLYCRMSVGDDGTIFKCEDQERQGRESVADWARDQRKTFGPDGEVRIGEALYDHAKSAWKPYVDRPSFNMIMDRLEGRASDGVWVRDVDRFTRKMREAVQIADAAEGGAFVLALRSSYDLSKRKDRKRFLEDALDAEDESSRISERSRDGVLNKAMRGRSTATQRGFARPGYLPNPPGWQAGDPRTRVPEEQLAREVAAVRDAADRVLAGQPLAAIAAEWNEAGLLTTRGGEWMPNRLKQMLETPAIAGLTEYKGKIVGEINDEMHPPVLDRTTYDRLKLFFSTRKRGRPASVYLLSGIIRCGGCGGLLYGRPRVKTPYEDGSPRREYWCAVRPKDSGCGRNSIDQRFADRCVEELVVVRMGDPRNSDRIARVAVKMEKQQEKIRAELSALNEEADALSDKLGQPGWTVARVDRGLAKYAALTGEAQARLDALGEIPDTSSAKSSRDEAQADWDAADGSGRRTLVKRAIPEGIFLMPAERRGAAALVANRFRIG